MGPLGLPTKCYTIIIHNGIYCPQRMERGLRHAITSGHVYCASIHYVVRHPTIRSRDVSKSRDRVLKWAIKQLYTFTWLLPNFTEFSDNTLSARNVYGIGQDKCIYLNKATCKSVISTKRLHVWLKLRIHMLLCVNKYVCQYSLNTYICARVYIYIYTCKRVYTYKFKIQEWFIAISTEIYMAYTSRLKPRCAYLPWCTCISTWVYSIYVWATPTRTYVELT